MIAKCVLPFGSRVTAIQGSDPASSRSTRSFFREEHLLDRHAKLDRDRLERFNRRPVDVRLARLAQTPIAHRDAVAFDIGLERSGPQSIAEDCTTSGTRRLFERAMSEPE